MPRVQLARASARRRQFFTVVATSLPAPQPAERTAPVDARPDAPASEERTAPAEATAELR